MSRCLSRCNRRCVVLCVFVFFFFSSRRRHTRCLSDWSSDVCSSDLSVAFLFPGQGAQWPGMARELCDTEPSFREDVERSCGRLGPETGPELLRLLQIGRASCRDRV